MGTPQELSDEKGEVVWLSYDRAWGKSYRTVYEPQAVGHCAVSADDIQPFKFQGQMFDGESNLHYNRFRYYDYDVGMFIQRDPIGLNGGMNVFQYAPNPVQWIDPLGLEQMTYGLEMLGYSQQAASTLEYQAIADADCYQKTGNACNAVSSQYSLQLFDYVVCSAGVGALGGAAAYNLHNGTTYLAGALSRVGAKSTLGKVAKISKNPQFKLPMPTLANIKKSFSASCMAGYIMNKDKNLSSGQATDSFLGGLGVSESVGAYGVRLGVTVPVNSSFFDRNAPAGIEVGVGTPGADIGTSYNWEVKRTAK